MSEHDRNYYPGSTQHMLINAAEFLKWLVTVIEMLEWISDSFPISAVSKFVHKLDKECATNDLFGWRCLINILFV